MGLFTTGVCVVSVDRPDGTIGGVTVNSLVSVSLDPMLVCWGIQNTSSQFDLYTQAPYFAVSILAERHATLARRYAARGATGYEDVDFTRSPNGLPVIADALGQLECARWSLYRAGDHTMIFGEVTALELAASQGSQALPLGFFNGQFCAIAP
ncbi:MAG: flavin reductase family protein [Erythrobacter sp.]